MNKSNQDDIDLLKQLDEERQRARKVDFLWLVGFVVVCISSFVCVIHGGDKAQFENAFDECVDTIGARECLLIQGYQEYETSDTFLNMFSRCVDSIGLKKCNLLLGKNHR